MKYLYDYGEEVTITNFSYPRVVGRFIISKYLATSLEYKAVTIVKFDGFGASWVKNINKDPGLPLTEQERNEILFNLIAAKSIL